MQGDLITVGPLNATAAVDFEAPDVPANLDADLSTLDWDYSLRTVFDGLDDSNNIFSGDVILRIDEEQPRKQTADALSNTAATKNTISSHDSGLLGSKRNRESPHYHFLSDHASKIPRLSLTPIWNRGADTETWNFCARQLLSCVGTFSKAASNPFILQMPSVMTGLGDRHMTLQRALGLCAAHETLAKSNRPVFEALLNMEISQLINMSTHGNFAAIPINTNSESAELRSFMDSYSEDLSRLQAMVLYMTMQSFSPSSQQRQLAESLQPILVSWTRELLVKTQVLENYHEENFHHVHASNLIYTDCHEKLSSGQFADSSKPSSLAEEPYTEFKQTVAYDKIIESAYRTVLVSYLIRSVYSALVYQCDQLVPELASLPVFITEMRTSEQPDLKAKSKSFYLLSTQANLSKIGRRTTYGALGEAWKENQMAPITMYDQFIVLLLVACKGVDILPPECRYRPSNTVPVFEAR